MQYTAILVSALAALPFAAASNAIVNNYCPKALCVFTTQPGGGPVTGTYTVQPGKNFIVNYPARGAVGSNVKISPTCDINNAVFWEFAQGNDGNIYYDVNINGPPSNPFSVRGCGVTGSTSACPAISCKPGSNACFNNPNGMQQNQVKACSATNSIFFNACKP